jgi:hypothetical protein
VKEIGSGRRNLNSSRYPDLPSAPNAAVMLSPLKRINFGF